MAMHPDQFHLLDPAVVEDPYPFYRALLRHAPLYQIPGTPVYLVSGAQLVHEVLRNQDDYSANLTGILIRGAGGDPELFDFSQFGGTVNALANADEPFHAVHRKLVLPQLTARRVAAMEPEISAWVQTSVNRLCAAGRGDGVAALANPIPVQVMARLVGLPVEDVDQLLQWAFAGGDILAGTGDVSRMIELATSTAGLSAYLSAHVEAVQASSFDEAHSVMQALVRGVEQGAIDRQAAIAILVVLVGAAGESTSSLLGSAMRLLAEDLSLQQQLRAAPALIEPFIEEVLRLEAPFKGHYRVVKRQTQLGGFTLPAQSRVILLWAAANRDPAVFDRPDTLDLQRRDGNQHLGFGHGIHFCIGARLARLEASIVLRELLASTRAFRPDPARPVRHVASIFVRRPVRVDLQLEVA